MATNVEVDCFIIKHNQDTIYSEGNSCDLLYSPASTFKIVISLMGYEENILLDEEQPILSSTNKVYYDFWKGEKTPKLWIENSVLWYSQYITEKIGKDKFVYYINLLDYGNKDVSGSDVLTRSWISSTLKISSRQQLLFIEKLANYQLPFSYYSQDTTKKIIFSKSIDNYNLYSKTGMSTLLDANNKRTNYNMGYYIGFLENNNDSKDKYYFVIHVSEIEKINKFASLVAKDIALEKIKDLILLSK